MRRKISVDSNPLADGSRAGQSYPYTDLHPRGAGENMRARDLCRVWLVALGLCIACVCAVQASETLPLAIAATQ